MSMSVEDLTRLRDSARALLETEWPAAGAVERLADPGALASVWRAIASQGWLNLAEGEDAPGLPAAIYLQQELGRASCPLPLAEVFLTQLLLGDRAAEAMGTSTARDVILAWAWPNDQQPVCMDNGRLSGLLTLVEATSFATHLAVVHPAEHRLGIVRLDHPGIARTVQAGYAQPALADVRLSDVPAKVFELASDKLGPIEDLSRVLLVARAWGAAQRGFEMIVEYAQIREQFGQPIGRFQAIQHKLADCFIRLEGCRELLQLAADAYESGDPEALLHVQVAAAFGFANLRQVVLETHHAFGAIGYMEEHELPRHFRRVHADLVRQGGLRRARDRVAQTLWQRSGRALPDFDLGPRANAFRAEVREWLTQAWSPALQAAHHAKAGERWHVSPEFARALGARGLLAVTLPKASGGAGRSGAEEFACKEELFYRNAPTWFQGAGDLIAHGILTFGSDEQRSFFLPKLLRGELCFCLGYSEPNAGSDLTSLRTRAVRDGDDWVINGQKIWTSNIEAADYIWLAVRTDPDLPKHKGISVFLVARDTPGVSFQRIRAMNGHIVGAVFFDAVRVPAGAMVGQPNQGWQIINAALATERITMGAGVARLQYAFDVMLERVRADPGLAGDPSVAQRLAELTAELQAARALAVAAVRVGEQGGVPLKEAALSKVYSGELSQRICETALDLFGPAATLGRDAPGAIAQGVFEDNLRNSIMMVVGGGSAEIQRNIIAQQALGLPR